MEKEKEDLMMDSLNEWINDENRIVTYKWLSISQDLHVNQSKQLLESFVQKSRSNKTDAGLTVVYCLSGFVQENDSKTFKLEIVKEEERSTVVEKFLPPVACHVYSVQKGTLKSSTLLFSTDFDLMKKNVSSINQHSGIRCGNATHRVEAEVEMVQEPAQPAANAATLFQNNSDKGKKPAAPKPNTAMQSFFGKQTNAKVASVKSDKNKNSTCEKIVTKEDKKSESSKQMNVNPCSGKAKKEVEIVEDEQTKKKDVNANNAKKRRIFNISDSESSEEEMEIENEDPLADLPEVPSPSSSKITEDKNTKTQQDDIEMVDASAENGGDNTGKGITNKRVLKTKTYLNDEGFMVTEKVWETTQVTESEAEMKSIEKPPTSAKNSKETAPEPEKNKKKSAAAAQKASASGNKQTSLMNFFAKK